MSLWIRKSIFLVSHLAVVLLGLNWGASEVDLWSLLQNATEFSDVFWEIRLPRIFVALICGASLAMAGVISQGFFRNSLAGPSILGTSSGSNFFVILFFLYFGLPSSWYVVPALAFFGASIATIAIVAIARLGFLQSNTQQLLLTGLALNALFGALSTFTISLSLEDYGLSQMMVRWVMGGISFASWDHVILGFPLALSGLILGRLVCIRLDLFNLGEDIATSLSVSKERLQWSCIMVIAVLVSAAVSLSGGITFVGLLVPHFTRKLLGSDHKQLLYWSALNGATVVLLSDSLARNIVRPSEIPVGAVIALIGAPSFILLLLSKRAEYA